MLGAAMFVPPTAAAAPTAAPTAASSNLAAGKTTAQSSTQPWNYPASHGNPAGVHDGASERAVDGNADPTFSHSSCTHTQTSMDPWWRVDLGERQLLCTVRITNRGDEHTDRLNGFEVRAGDTEGDGTTNHNCGNGGHATPGAGATVDVSCEGYVARYVNVRIPGSRRILTLCEVEVFACTSAPTPYQPGTPTGSPMTTTPTTSRSVCADWTTSPTYWTCASADGSGTHGHGGNDVQDLGQTLSAAECRSACGILVSLGHGRVQRPVRMRPLLLPHCAHHTSCQQRSRGHPIADPRPAAIDGTITGAIGFATNEGTDKFANHRRSDRRTNNAGTDWFANHEYIDCCTNDLDGNKGTDAIAKCGPIADPHPVADEHVRVAAFHVADVISSFAPSALLHSLDSPPTAAPHTMPSVSPSMHNAKAALIDMFSNISAAPTYSPPSVVQFLAVTLSSRPVVGIPSHQPSFISVVPFNSTPIAKLDTPANVAQTQWPTPGVRIPLHTAAAILLADVAGGVVDGDGGIPSGDEAAKVMDLSAGIGGMLEASSVCNGATGYGDSSHDMQDSATGYCIFEEAFISRGAVSVLFSDPSVAECKYCKRLDTGVLLLPPGGISVLLDHELADRTGVKVAVSVLNSGAFPMPDAGHSIPISKVVHVQMARGGESLDSLPANATMRLRFPVPPEALQTWPCGMVLRAYDETTRQWGAAVSFPFPQHVNARMRDAGVQRSSTTARNAWCASQILAAEDAAQSEPGNRNYTNMFGSSSVAVLFAMYLCALTLAWLFDRNSDARHGQCAHMQSPELTVEVGSSQSISSKSQSRDAGTPVAVSEGSDMPDSTASSCGEADLVGLAAEEAVTADPQFCAGDRVRYRDDCHEWVTGAVAELCQGRPCMPLAQDGALYFGDEGHHVIPT
eukprot:gene57741-biopygen6204